MTLFTSITVPLVYTLILVSATFWPVMPNIYWLIPLSLISVAWVIKRRFVALTVFIALSVALIQGNLLKHQSGQLFRFGTDVTIKANVDSYFKQISQGYEVDVTILEINDEPTYRLNRPQIKLRVTTPIEIGSVVSAPVRLKRIVGLLNSVGYDKEKHYFSTGMIAQADIAPSSHVLISSARYWKSFTYRQIQKATEASRYQAYYLALIFGDRSLLTPRDWAQLRESGLSHLMAISGLHVGIVFAIGVLLGRCVRVVCSKLLKPGALLSVIQAWGGVTIGFMLAGGYGALANYSVPTVRALLMLVVLYFFYARKVKTDTIVIVLISSSVVLTLLPFSSASMSFWLSYYAVTALIILSVGHHGPEKSESHKRHGWAYFHLGLAILFLPLLVFLFNGVSLGSSFYNLVFVPWFTFVVIPSLLVITLCSLVVSHNGLYGAVMDPLLSVVDVALSYSHWFWLELEVLYVWLLMTLICLWYLRVWMNVQVLVCLGVTAGITVIVSDKKPGFQVNVLDIGHGLAVIIQQGKEAVIYDTGMEVNGFSIAERVITPTLTRLGIDSVKGLILSHSDNDHAGGAQALINTWPLIWIRRPDVSDRARPCKKGEKWYWKSVTFEALWPPKLVTRAYNPHSCVVLMTYYAAESGASYRVLFAGDVDKIGEILLFRDLSLQNIDVLIVPHHGSKTSSSRFLMSKVTANYAVASTRFGGRWNLPNPAIKESYQRRGSIWHDTGSAGQVVYRFNGQEVSASSLRSDKLAPWYRQMLRSGVE
ncbi:DNA internalization-related competence protein ComEC/Rec2 [Vibrio sp. 10N.261.51.F12]|uniref:DNA internalization-related competence protein ComEC/Rec2 n=1 Tax=Vibrio sp. 10N.261.51.F12 TaxID=3229679 RepID=UPI0035532130